MQLSQVPLRGLGRMFAVWLFAEYTELSARVFHRRQPCLVYSAANMSTPTKGLAS